jgi:hypothetical protein
MNAGRRQAICCLARCTAAITNRVLPLTARVRLRVHSPASSRVAHSGPGTHLQLPCRLYHIQLTPAFIKDTDQFTEYLYGEEQVDMMGDTKSISTTSSGDKKRKRAAPAYFAVRRGRTPGIYYSWADAQEQINQFPGSECTYVSVLTHICSV